MNLRQEDYDEFLKLQISREIVDRAGVFRVTRAEAEGLGIHLDCDGGICFPVFLPPLDGNDAKHAVSYSVRQDAPPRDAAGKMERKYLTVAGQHYPYVVPANPEWFADPSVPVVIVEAEKSALSLLRWTEDHQRHFIPVGIAGCYGWRGTTGIKPTPDGGREPEKGLLPVLAAICKKHRVYIMLDANAATNPSVQRGRDWLAQTLLEEKITTDVRILKLPPSVTAPHYNGPDDFIAARGDEAFAEIFEGAERCQQTVKCLEPRVWNSRDFIVEVFPPREPLMVIKSCDTPVLTARSINQIFARRGTGKSMLALGLAGVLSTGGDFLNWKVVRPARVLYVDGELPDAQIQQRLRELHSHQSSISLVTLDSTPGGIPHLATAPGQVWLEKALDGVEVLILDSIATLAPFSTNDEELWIPYRSWLMRLRSRGLCTIELHQAGKQGLQRGHSRGDDALDVQIKLEAKDEEIDDLACTLIYEKFRGQKNGVRALNVEFSNGTWTWSLLETDKLKMLEEYVCAHPTASSRTIARDLPELGGYKTVQRMLNKLKQQAA